MGNVLLIDDDVDLVEMNRIVLQQRGHNIRFAYSAAEARVALTQGLPDVVVLDIMMESDSAGIELAREIHELYPNLPTVILSSIHEVKHLPYRFTPDENWLPVLKFLDKPVDPADLADEIEAILVK
jgi:DNA-binding NtrC family response regulator